MADVANPWDTLVTTRAQHDELVSIARTISDTCKATHSKEHIIQCAECYSAVLAAARDHFLGSSSVESTTLPSSVRDNLRDALSDASYPPAPGATQHPLQKAEEIIRRARGAYIRQLLSDSVAVKEFATSGEGGMSEAEFRKRTTDPEADPRALLADILGAAVRRQEIRSRDVEKQVERLEEATAKGDEEAKLGVLMDVLFAKSPAGAEGEGGVPGMEGGKAVAPDTKDAQTALSRLRAGQSLETVLRLAAQERNAPAEAINESKAISRAKRLAELRRGKAALESKKKQRESDRAGSQEKTHAQLPDEFYDPPRCRGSPGFVGCMNDISTAEARDGAGLICCDICLLEALVRDRMRPTYWCPEHVEAAFDKHVETQHGSCAAPIADCVTDRAGATAPSWDEVVVCKDCLFPGPNSPESSEILETPPGAKVTIYCTADCASADWKRHQETSHPSSQSLNAGKFVDELRRLKEEYGITDDMVKKEN